MQDENNRNTIIFVVCAFLILMAYQFLVIEPANQKKTAEQLGIGSATLYRRLRSYR